MLFNKGRNPHASNAWLVGMAGPRQTRSLPVSTPVSTPTISTSPVAYVFLLGVVGITLVRPMDLLTSLKGLPLYQVVLAAALMINARGIRDQFNRVHLREQPTTVCVIAVYLAIVMSHLTHAYLAGATDISFIPVMLFYLMIVSLVDSPERLQQFLKFVALTGTSMVTLCLLDFLGLIDVGGITHLSGKGEDIAAAQDWRMRGVGVFEDPNDLATLVVFLGTLCVWAQHATRNHTARLFWCIALAILLVALLCTRSRGGLLAAAAAGSVLAYWRYGKTAVLCTCTLGLMLLPVLSGRTAGISGDDSTAFDRVMLWREGMHAMMSPDFAFGIGAGRYEELDGLVAHNSFIHAFVELGFVGGCCFVGWFLFPALALYRVARYRCPCSSQTLTTLFPYITAFLAGWCVSLLSLSRCYAPSTILVVGIAAAYVNLLGKHLEPPRKLVRWDRRHLLSLFTFSSLSLFMFYCFVRVVT